MRDIRHALPSAMRRAHAGALSLLAALALVPARAGTLETFDPDAYRGKVVLLDFWASWCAPCKESFPWMQRMEDRYRDRGLVVVAVNVDRQRELADRFLLVQQPRFAVVFDPEGRLADRYHVAGMPSSFYIDRSGRIRHTHVGFRASERQAAELELDELVSERQ